MPYLVLTTGQIFNIIKMIKLIAYTILGFILVLLVSILYINHPKVTFSIESLGKEYLPKDKVSFRVTLMNKGKKNNYFSVILDSKIEKSAPTVIYLPVDISKEITYSLDIPPDTAPGDYKINVSIMLPKDYSFPVKKIASDAISFTLKEPPPAPVVKKVEDLRGNVSFTNVPERFTYNTVTNINAGLQNTSTTNGTFKLLLNVLNPESNVWVSSVSVNLSAGEKKEIQFQYSVPAEYSDGEYLLTLELYDRKLDKLLASDTRILGLTDNAPKIEINTMFDKEQKKINILCKAKDDKAIKDVSLHINDLAKKYTTSYSFVIITGNKQNGVWEAALNLNKRTNKTDFYISATDTKDQTAKTETFKLTSFSE